jgi:hypothetical protein
MSVKMTPLLAKAIEVRFCAQYPKKHVSPDGDVSHNFTTRCVVVEHLKLQGVSHAVIRSLIPDPDAWGLE